jgi:hypothetical protein
MHSVLVPLYLEIPCSPLGVAACTNAFTKHVQCVPYVHALPQAPSMFASRDDMTRAQKYLNKNQTSVFKCLQVSGHRGPLLPHRHALGICMVCYLDAYSRCQAVNIDSHNLLTLIQSTFPFSAPNMHTRWLERCASSQRQPQCSTPYHIPPPRK